MRAAHLLTPALLLTAATLAQTARGPSGSLDASFGQGGRAVAAVGGTAEIANAAALQPDGKIVLAGHTGLLSDQAFTLARFTPEGALDPSFGRGGWVVAPVSNGENAAEAVAVAPDGKIVAAGHAKGPDGTLDFALARYNKDGSPDAGFGRAGKVLTAFGSGEDVAYALALLDGGKILAAGYAPGEGTGYDFALARYLPDGRLDPSFGTGGRVLTPVRPGKGEDVAHAVLVQRVGGAARYLVAGGQGDFSLARYREDGSLDPGFGAGGKVAEVFGGGGDGAAHALAAAGDKVVVAGHVDHDFALVRLTANGSLDAGFGSGGKVAAGMSPNDYDEIEAVTVAPDGKVLAAGWAYDGSRGTDFVLARFNPNGSPDRTFGDGGRSVTPVAAAGGNDKAMAMALRPDGRVLLAGHVLGRANSYDFALARYWP